MFRRRQRHVDLSSGDLVVVPLVGVEHMHAAALEDPAHMEHQRLKKGRSNIFQSGAGIIILFWGQLPAFKSIHAPQVTRRYSSFVHPGHCCPRVRTDSGTSIASRLRPKSAGEATTLEYFRARAPIWAAVLMVVSVNLIFLFESVSNSSSRCSSLCCRCCRACTAVREGECIGRLPKTGAQKKGKKRRPEPHLRPCWTPPLPLHCRIIKDRE